MSQSSKSRRNCFSPVVLTQLIMNICKKMEICLCIDIRGISIIFTRPKFFEKCLYVILKTFHVIPLVTHFYHPLLFSFLTHLVPIPPAFQSFLVIGKWFVRVESTEIIMSIGKIYTAQKMKFPIKYLFSICG